MKYRRKFTWGRRKRDVSEDFVDNELQFNVDDYDDEEDMDIDAYDRYENSPDISESQIPIEDEMDDNEYMGLQADHTAATYVKELEERVSQKQNEDSSDPNNTEKKNVGGKNQKRFLFKKVQFHWQVCKTKDALTCAIYLIPKFSDHQLRKYESSINNVKSYRTIKGKYKSDLGDALVSSCNGQ